MTREIHITIGAVGDTFILEVEPKEFGQFFHVVDGVMTYPMFQHMASGRPVELTATMTDEAKALRDRLAKTAFQSMTQGAMA